MFTNHSVTGIYGGALQRAQCGCTVLLTEDGPEQFSMCARCRREHLTRSHDERIDAGRIIINARRATQERAAQWLEQAWLTSPPRHALTHLASVIAIRGEDASERDQSWLRAWMALAPSERLIAEHELTLR